MAFTSVGSIGSALSSGNNQASLVLTTSAACDVGNVIILAIAVDNPTGTGGASTAVSGVSDNSPGGPNTWVRAVGFTNTNGGAAQDGADISIWYSRITTQIANGGTITATFANATTSDASAMSGWEFTAGASGVVDEATAVLANDAAAAGSLDATTNNIQCIRFRATASESNSSTVWTKTAAFTSLIDQAVSGAGTSATEMGVRGEWAITTGTGLASAPTGGAGAVDNASAYLALRQIPWGSLATFGGSGSLSIETSIIAGPDLNKQFRPVLRKPYRAPLRINYGFTRSLFPGLAGAVANNIAATFNGTGNLSAATVQRMVAAATFAGAGNLTTSANLRMPAAATFAGAGALTVSGRLVLPAFATFQGTGSLSVRASGQTTGAATFAGSGNFSANATLNMQAAVIFNGGGNLSAQTIQAGFQSGAATFNGTGNLSAATVQWMIASATFAGTGNLLVSASSLTPALATFAGAGSLSVRAMLVQPAFATFQGTGSLTASASGQTTGSATFQGSGSLSVLANLRMQIAATFSGAGNLIVDTQSATKTGEASFAGAGNLSVRASQVLFASALFNGLGSLLSSVNPYALPRSPYFVRPVRPLRINYGFVRSTPAYFEVAAPANQIAATFQGSGSMSVRANLVMRVTATFAGSGVLSALTVSADQYMPSVAIGWPAFKAKFPVPMRSWRIQPLTLMAGPTVHSGAAIFNGTGGLSASAIQAGFHEGQATFNGVGNMSASVRQVHVQGATFQGAGNLSVNVTAKLGAAAIFNGAGEFRADTVIAGFHSGSATFNGSGSMSVAVAQRHIERATFEGTGSLSVVGSMRMPAAAIFGGLGVLSVDAFKPVAFAQATFNGAGLLSVSTVARQAALATFNGAGNFTITVVARYAASVQFTGTGTMLVSVVHRETAAARFDGAGNLSANANLRMQVAARFAGASSLTVDTLHVPFGFNFCEAQFSGRGGMICDTLQFGPRHVQSSRPQIGVTSTRPGVPAARRPQPPAQKRTGT